MDVGKSLLNGAFTIRTFEMPGTWKKKHPIASFELCHISMKEQWRTGTAVALNYMLFGIGNSGLTRFYYVSDVCR